MVDTDLPVFAELLDSVCNLMTRGQYTPNDNATAIFFAALEEHPMPVVRAAFAAHVRGSRFSPTPADLLDHIRGLAQADGRPGAEEAWAIALTAKDEASTVVWTAEMAQAWGVARVVEQNGDEVGARMTFKEVYTRLVAEARAARRPMEWQATLGHDPALREAALSIAAEQGRLPSIDADTLALPAPRGTPTLLEAPALMAAAPADVVARLVAVRERLTAAGEYVPGPGFMAIARTAELRQASEQRAQVYGGGGR